jgi:Spy/CpxP family protein refolding chaperone
MKHATLFPFFLAVLLVLPVATFGQEAPPRGDVRPDDQRDMRRPNLLAELGLAPEQIQQIRRMNQERRPKMQEARRRMGEAQRNLDMAIYADTLVSDAEFQARLKEFQAAEAELARLRFEGEFIVRKVLTPEQLVRFRELRRRFAEAARDRFPNRRRQRGAENPLPPAKDAVPRKPGI